jgi:hypothetical protein
MVSSLVFTLLFFFSGCSSLELQRFPASTLQVPSNVSQLAYWETQTNGAGRRSLELFDLDHYEIPLRILGYDSVDNLDPLIRDTLVFTKDGEEYVRWIANPEDTEYRYEVENFLRQQGLDAEYRTELKGHLTASRSLLVFNPENGASFSLKTSTNLTGGLWRDKRQTWTDAQQIRKVSDMALAVQEKMLMDHIIFMHEPLAIGLEELDLGMVVRSLNDVAQDQKHYLPAFSALHEEEGIRIARLNGSDDVRQFWREHLNKPLARAMAEFLAFMGLTYDSPHSQNFMIELDAQLRPTGKIVLRDFGDSYLFEQFIEKTQYQDLIPLWDTNNITKNHLDVSVALMNGNVLPSWLSLDEYFDWGDEFFEEFEESFSKFAGIPKSSLSRIRLGQDSEVYQYADARGSFRKKYPFINQMKAYTTYASCLTGNPAPELDCPRLYQLLRKDLSCNKATQALVP